MNNITNIARAEAPLDFISSGFCRFTPAQANAVFTHCRYEFNRNEKQGRQHILALSRMMKAGQWRRGGGIEFARAPDGKLTLVDGHHRMLAQVEAGVDIEWTVIIHDLETADQVRDLFWTFDTTLRKRSMANVLSGVNAADGMGVSSKVARALAGAAVYIDNGMRAPAGGATRIYTPAERLELASKWAAEARDYERAISNAPAANKSKLHSSQVVAVALITLRADPVQAKEFWAGLASDDGLRRGDPRKSLLDWLRSTHLSSAGMQTAAVACARAWAAWVSGKDINFIRIGKTPVRIAGTSIVVQP